MNTLVRGGCDERWRGDVGWIAFARGAWVGQNTLFSGHGVQYRVWALERGFSFFDRLDVITANLNMHHGGWASHVFWTTRETRPISRFNRYLVLEKASLQVTCCAGFHEFRLQYLKELKLLCPYRESWRREAIAHSPRVPVPCQLPIQPHMIKTDDWATKSSPRGGGNHETDRTPNTMLVFHMIVEKKPNYFITLVRYCHRHPP
jgi:hypothetical protein